MISTVVPKASAILSAKTVEGMNLPVSMELTACLDTPILSASSACVQFFFALSTLIVFFIIKVIFAPGYCNSCKIENNKNGNKMPVAPIFFVQGKKKVKKPQGHQ